MKRTLVLFVLVTVLVFSSAAQATTNDGKKWGVGLAGGLGVGGLSGTMDTGGPMSYQLIAGNGVAGKLRFAFQRQPSWDIYFDGFAGFRAGWDDALTAGGGVGIDWDWRSLSEGLPPISFSLETNAGIVNGNFGVDPKPGIHFNF